MISFNLGRFNVKQKLGFLIFCAISMLVVVGLAGLMGAKRIENALTVVSEEKLPTANTLSTIRNSMATLHSVCLEASLWRGKKYAQKYFKSIHRRIGPLDKELTEAVDKYDKLTLAAEEREAWEAFKSTYVNWHTYATRTSKVILELGNNEDNGSNTEEAMAKQEGLFDDFDMSVAPWGVVEPALQKALATLVEANLRSGESAVEVGRTASKAANIAIAGIFGIAAAILIVLGFVMSRSIIKPLESMRRAIVTVATDNDFTNRADVTTRDEAGETAQAFNQLIEQMQSSLREVLDNATQISNAAHQAAGVSRQVSDASYNQSESASAMAAAIEEMTVSITHINDSTRDALQRAHEAGDAANSGAETIARTNTEMTEIANTVHDAVRDINEVGVQSNKISMMVQVIKDVADQTNLLALNAAIEAARAGEQGRGFAVVADEVRKLAERTASSTTEIARIVESMQSSTRNAVSGMDSVVQRVDVGQKLSDQAAGRVGEIQGGAKQVAEAINDIAVALNEQSSVAQDIARRVETIAQMSEENTVAATNTAQVAQELDQLAEALRQTAGHFKV
jgi:methyl-accepting chemotaxis protein